MIKGLLIIAAAIFFGVWWWRKNYVPSPLEVHLSDLEMKQKNGALANMAAYVAQPVAAMFGSGWATTTIVNPTNPSYNKPGTTRLNVRFVQPSQ
jgi:hypothetical protein